MKPSDNEIEMLAAGFAIQHKNGLIRFAHALLDKYAPQASAENVRNAALEEAARMMEQTGKRIAASDIRALKQPQADKDGGQWEPQTPEQIIASMRAFALSEGFDWPAPAKSAGAGEPIAWESTTPPFIKYVTDSKYRKFRPGVQKWYRPYRCASCAALSAPQAEQGEQDA